ncbi:uncharacterized protein H6S33_000697 [Morchella sextelata]|uniref:uncharacterized protein n=1 Tax=Morchella sextelata TaxID=1174677 RepID=UPI001D059326|nr:uncharacterized protein H6S33_000697 [Morchella sextelata]KAH0615061.1 hypothetical protein H6S33_000697 [Morchella sextelata]
MSDQARVSYMTKEQLETYLSDLRSNRPQRPIGARPLSTTKARWTPQSSVSLLDAAPSLNEPRLHPSPPRPALQKAASSPDGAAAKTTDDAVGKRDSWLLRRNSHKRSQTFSAPSIASSILPRSSTPTRITRTRSRAATASVPPAATPPFAPPETTEAEREAGWDGKDLQEGRMGDTPPKKLFSTDSATAADSASTTTTTTKRGNSLKKQGSFSFREFSKFGTRHERTGSSGSASTSSSSSSSGGGIAKKTVSWALPSLSRPSSPSPVVMPPTHPPPKSASTRIEEELTSHFRSLPPAPMPYVAPLRINKSPSQRSTPLGRSESAAKLPIVPEAAAATPPTRKESSVRTAPIFSAPGRRAYIDPHKKEPTQHNKVKYTTNPVPLPSPPMSGSEEEDAEAEALKELGRRPLPKAGNGSSENVAAITGGIERIGGLGSRSGGGVGFGRNDTDARKNRSRYGAQVQPQSAAPIIGLVTMPTPPPTASSSTSNKMPPVPSICVPDKDDSPRVPVPIPSFNFPDEDPTPVAKPKQPSQPPPSIPMISLPDEAPSGAPARDPTGPSASRRPLPIPRGSAKGPASAYSGSNSSGYVNSRGPTASCAYCRTPIEGRVVSASSIRFHPECFRCDHCHTTLEHVGFFPEPEESRKRRVEVEGEKGGKVRFYCHLDFHELFSPRCRSCKTPIEGEVVVACGGTWHAGHFFCAECGDPFNSESRFVEKDGYAWCVGCYQNRYSGKCKKCKKPVTETVVKALGGEWHEECFCCTECGNGFDDGRFFIRGKGGNEIPVCVGCEERRLKR